MKRIIASIMMVVLILGLMPVISVQKEVVADGVLEIVTPFENELLGAGYVEIEWNDTTGKSAEYSIYVDGTCIGTTTSTSYEYYTTNVKMYTTYVVANYSDNTSKTSNQIKFAVTKKGLCVNETMGKYLEPVDMNIGWYYNWSPTEFTYRAYKNVDFVPMIWGIGSDGSIPAVAEAGYNYLLAYNEPDMGNDVGGSNTDVETVVEHWNNFLGYDFHLGAPAPALSPSWDNGTWFRTFMDSVDHDTMDFIPLHCYYGSWGGANAASWFLEDVVDKTYAMYGKPIWITEFAISGWNINNADNVKSVKEFMEAVIEGLNERSYVERFSWFSFDSVDTNNGASALWTNSTGELTELGELYVACGNPAGYVPTEPEELNYSITESTRTTLLDNSIIIDEMTYEDYVAVDGVSASASTNIDGNNIASKAIDEDVLSRWESIQGVDPQHIIIDLGQTRNIKKVDIIWEAASAANYTIEVSDDGVEYTVIADIEGGSATQNRLDEVVLKKMASGRYIKINGTSRSTAYGYSIYDLAIYGAEVADDTHDIEILGYQYSTAYNGFRVVSAVEPTINNKEVVEYGNIYGIVLDGLTAESMTIDSDSNNVKSFAATNEGVTSVKYSESDTATNYVMTMINNGDLVEAYTQHYMVRAYAKLSDGTYVYSDVSEFSIYEIADYLYKNQKMGTATKHNYLYENILSRVKQDYELIVFNWGNSLYN